MSCEASPALSAASPARDSAHIRIFPLPKTMMAIGSRSYAPLLPISWSYSRRSLRIGRSNPRGSCNLHKRTPSDFSIHAAANMSSSSAPSAEKNGAEVQEQKSVLYSNNMTEAMGADLTYHHELGMNYNFIRPDLIVGSCLQSPSDVDKLVKIGVRTIFCLQQNSDLEYFGVDIQAIQEYANKCDNIEHHRAEIRDFDAFDLRMRLPAVVSKLHRVINRNGGVTYIHCTAGLGRAPAVALAYMYWVLGYKLSEAHNFLQSRRACCPKLEAIQSATADTLTGLSRNRVRLTWKGGKCSSVEVSGLDIGWGQRIPLKFDQSQGFWLLERDLPDGRYEYKYIVDGEWTCNDHDLKTIQNRNGHVNNYIVVSSTDSDTISLRKRLMAEDGLTKEARRIIRELLEQYNE